MSAAIDYEAFNDMNENADVSGKYKVILTQSTDEEDLINREIADAKSTKSRVTATNSKFDKIIKAEAMNAQATKEGRYKFSNYFVSVKTQPTKLTKQDEEKAKKLFLDMKPEPEPV